MIRKILYFVLIALAASSCTEKVTIKLDSTYTRVVVDGSIENDSGVYQVALTKSADYFSNEPVPKIVNAHVSISDGSVTYELTETLPGISGKYQTSPGFIATAGKTYSLHVDLPEEIGGKSTVDASSYLPPVTRLDSISTEFHSDWGPDGIWTIKLWALEPGNEVNYYLFNYYRNGELMSDTITKKVVSDDKFYNGSYMTGVNVIYINNEHPWTSLQKGDTIMLQMSGITKEYYNFINQVQQSGFNLPFFTGPPANVQGNISNGGIGFFAAYSNSFAKTVVK
jgi:hypothetical protein